MVVYREGGGGVPKLLYRLPIGRFKMDVNSMILYNCHMVHTWSMCHMVCVYGGSGCDSITV